MKQRELKFRYWHKKEKRFVYLKAINFIDDMVTYDCQGECNYVDSASFDDITTQQYTGLKDKNGDEIYEGDIVKYDNNETAQKPIIGLAEVIYMTDMTLVDAPCFGLWFIGNKSGFYKSMLGDIEVIGNIFENQELLKQ